MNVTVTDVLGSLFNPTDTVCFRVFDDTPCFAIRHLHILGGCIQRSQFANAGA